jgi:hypothetical protein
MQHGLGIGVNTTTPALEDAIVMLLDPDMVLLRPLSHDFTDRNDIEWIVDDNHPEPATKVVKHGFPIAQQDGYLSSEWMSFNLTYIVNGTLREKPVESDGPRIWNSGPPYMATVKDMYAMAQKWVEFVPRVHHVYPQLFAGKSICRLLCGGWKIRICSLTMTVCSMLLRHRNVWPCYGHSPAEPSIYHDSIVCGV